MDGHNHREDELMRQRDALALHAGVTLRRQEHGQRHGQRKHIEVHVAQKLPYAAHKRKDDAQRLQGRAHVVAKKLGIAKYVSGADIVISEPGRKRQCRNEQPQGIERSLEQRCFLVVL